MPLGDAARRSSARRGRARRGCPVLHRRRVLDRADDGAITAPGSSVPRGGATSGSSSSTRTEEGVDEPAGCEPQAARSTRLAGEAVRPARHRRRDRRRGDRRRGGPRGPRRRARRPGRLRRRPRAPRRSSSTAGCATCGSATSASCARRTRSAAILMTRRRAAPRPAAAVPVPALPRRSVPAAGRAERHRRLPGARAGAPERARRRRARAAIVPTARTACARAGSTRTRGRTTAGSPSRTCARRRTRRTVAQLRRGRLEPRRRWRRRLVDGEGVVEVRARDRERRRAVGRPRRRLEDPRAGGRCG